MNAIGPIGMNFSYTYDGPEGLGFYGLKPGLPSTMDAVMSGARTSTLRRLDGPGSLPAAAQAGATVTFRDHQGRRQAAEVVGRRTIDPSMAWEASRRELWTPEFMDWYMRRHGSAGGQMEQLVYRLPGKPKIVAGIGSRDTPAEVLGVMTDLGTWMEENGRKLRSGGAAGADQAFEAGFRDPRNRAIYLPGQSFKGRSASERGFYDYSRLPAAEEARGTVDRYHPAPQGMKPFVRDLMARNAMQVLGPDLLSPADLVVAYAPGGYGNAGPTDPRAARSEGGTGQALRIARAVGIPIKNLADPATLEQTKRFLLRA